MQNTSGQSQSKLLPALASAATAEPAEPRGACRQFGPIYEHFGRRFESHGQHSAADHAAIINQMAILAVLADCV